MQIDMNSYSYTSTSVKLSVQAGANAQNISKAAGKDTSAAKESGDAYLSTAKYAPDMALVEQMKSSLQSSQQKLFDMVSDILSKQGMSVTQGQGFWRTLSGGQFQVDAATQDAAKQAISEDGEWGVKKTSERLLNFAKALTGGDPSKVEMMRDAFIKGFEAATKTWGKDLPDICKQTYDATMKLFDEWAGKGSEETASAAPARGNGGASRAGGASITIEYERTEISASSVSFSSGDRDAAQLEQAGIFSDVSEPLKYDGMTLKSAWCMNEKVTVTVTLGGGEQRPQQAPGKDGFVPSARPEEPPMAAYGPNGRRAPRGRHPHGPQLRPITFDVYKPVRLEKGEEDTRKTVRVGDRDLPLHEDGTVTVGLSDGTLRRARVNPRALEHAAGNGRVKVKGHEKNGKAEKAE